MVQDGKVGKKNCDNNLVILQYKKINKKQGLNS